VHRFPNRVLESSTATIGTGDVTVVGAVAGYQAFAAECEVGDTFPYYGEAVDGSGNPTGAWENGTGTLLTATTFSRSPESSSNSDALVNFGAGTVYWSIGWNEKMIFTRGMAFAMALNLHTP